jgi:hypothetical protein
MTKQEMIELLTTDVKKWNEWRAGNTERLDLRYSNLSGSNLRGSNLRDSDLSGSNLSGSDLRDSNLRGSDLSGSNLSGSDLRYSNLRGSDLRYSNLSGSNLRGSNLSDSNLSDSDLSGSDLSGSDLRYSNLRGSDLRDSDLSGSNLSGSDLRDSNLRGSDLRYSNLSGSKDLPISTDFLEGLESDENGLIVYKRIGSGATTYDPPESWTIAPGAVLTEVVNPCRTSECASGVNFGTREWCEKNYTGAELWKCRIAWIDLADVVVPYHTDGKARCARLTLLEVVDEKTS